MVGGSHGQWFSWSVREVVVSDVVSGRCFVFLMAGDRFLFLRMVGGKATSHLKCI